MQLLQVYAEVKNGGEWLAAARRWMQSNIKNGDILTWGSSVPVTVPFCKLEELARMVAIAAITEERNKRK